MLSTYRDDEIFEMDVLILRYDLEWLTDWGELIDEEVEKRLKKK